MAAKDFPSLSDDYQQSTQSESYMCTFSVTASQEETAHVQYERVGASIEATADSASPTMYVQGGLCKIKREMDRVIDEEQAKYKSQKTQLQKEIDDRNKNLEVVMSQILDRSLVMEEGMQTERKWLHAKDEKLSTREEMLHVREQELTARSRQQFDKEQELSAREHELRTREQELSTRKQEQSAKQQEQVDEQQHSSTTFVQKEKTQKELNDLAIEIRSQLDKMKEEQQVREKEFEQRMKTLLEDRMQLKEHLEWESRKRHHDVITSNNGPVETLEVPSDDSSGISIPATEVKFWTGPDHVLGKGAFGKVFSGQFGETPCAVKILNEVAMSLVSELPLHCSSGSEIDKRAKHSFLKEGSCLKRIDHKNVVKIYDVRAYPKGDYPVLIMEKLDCSLSTYLASLTSDVYPFVQLSLSCDVASALEYLQLHGIIHRDLCSDNVLLDKKSDIPVAKVSDFGMSKILKNFERMSTTLTAIDGHRAAYYPPEMLEDPESYDKSIDVFMLGVIMTQISFKCPQVSSVKKRKSLIADLKESHILKKHIECCVVNQQNERPPAKDVCTALRKDYESFYKNKYGYNPNFIQFVSEQIQFISNMKLKS